ncbi:MAG: hypothetical protein ACFFDV_12005 [Candidatus Thorarchaeota archaeon]
MKRPYLVLLILSILCLGTIQNVNGIHEKTESFVSSSIDVVQLASGNVREYSISSQDDIVYRKDSDYYLYILGEGLSNDSITLPSDVQLYGFIEWSYDAEWIYFHAINYTDTTTKPLMKIRPDGSDLTVVIPDIMGFSLAPNGTHVIYSVYETGGSIANASIYVADLALNNFELVYFGEGEYVYYLEWCQAGIFFEESESYSLYFMNETDYTIEPIFIGQSDNTAYRWPRGAPDGTSILCWRGNEDVIIWNLGNDGEHPFPVIQDYRDPSWFSNGRRIAMTGAGGLYSLEIPDPITTLDVDGDGLTNLEEWDVYSTDFMNGDSDSDNLGDGIEIRLGWNPNYWDSDDDGIGDSVEFAALFGEMAGASALPDGFIKITLMWSIYSMEIISNSTLLNAGFNQDTQELSFDVDGATGTIAVCNVTIPAALVGNAAIEVLIDGTPLVFTQTTIGDKILLQFVYTHSTHTLNVNLGGTPSGPSFDLVVLLIAGSTIALVVVIAIIFTRRRI